MLLEPTAFSLGPANMHLPAALTHRLLICFFSDQDLRLQLQVAVTHGEIVTKAQATVTLCPLPDWRM